MRALEDLKLGDPVRWISVRGNERVGTVHEYVAPGSLPATVAISATKRRAEPSVVIRVEKQGGPWFAWPKPKQLATLERIAS